MLACLLTQPEFLVRHGVHQLGVLEHRGKEISIVFQTRWLPGLPLVLEIDPHELTEDFQPFGVVRPRCEVGQCGRAVSSQGRFVGFDNLPHPRPFVPIRCACSSRHSSINND